VDDRQAAASRKTQTPGRRLVRLALRFAPVGVVVIAAAVLLASGVLKHLSLAELRASRHVLTAFVQIHPALSLLAYIGVYLGLVALSLPAPLIMTLTGGFLFGPWVGGLAALTGATSGAVTIFLISRLTVGDALERGVNPRIKAFEEGIKKDAFFYLLTLRLMPVTPFWLVNLAAGLLSIRLSTFVLATAIGILPVTFIYAGIGSGLGRIFDRGSTPHLRDLITPELALPLAGLALLSVLPIVYHQWRARRAAAAASVADHAGVQ
jgi:uncharacterized membrane protein YdjX (TVP38/TMEM64 family)